jgi:hypothetical protein
MATTVLAKKRLDFDPKQFLATIGQGRKVRSFPRKQTIAVVQPLPEIVIPPAHSRC